VKKLVFVGISLFGIGIICDDLCAARKQSTGIVSQVTIKGKSGSSTLKNQRVIKISDMEIRMNALEVLKSVVNKIPSNDLRSLNRNMLLLSRDLEISKKNEEVQEVISFIEQASVCFDDLLHQKADLYQKLFNKKEEKENISRYVSLDRVITQLNSVDLKKLKNIVTECKKIEVLRGIVGEWEAFSEKIKKSKAILAKMKQKLTTTVLNQIEGIPDLKNLSKFNTDYNQNLERQRKKKRNTQSRWGQLVIGQQSGVDEQYLINLEPSESELSSEDEADGTEQSSDNESENTGSNIVSGKVEAATTEQGSKITENADEDPDKNSKLEQPVIGHQSGVDEQHLITLEPSKPELPSEDEVDDTEQSSENEAENTGSNIVSGKVETTIAEQGSKITENAGEGPKKSSKKNNIEGLDFLKIKSLKEFYKHIGENLESIDENSAKDREKNRLTKLKKDLEDVQSDRSFEQKISDVKRVTKSYNRIVTSYLKTKEGKNLMPVSRDVIKSLQELIYIEIFDNLSSKLEKLRDNKLLEGTKIKEHIEKILSKNEKNKREFIKSGKGEERRRIMTDSVESYDQLMDELFQQQIKNRKGDPVDSAKLGYSLETVILSIDV